MSHDDGRGRALMLVFTLDDAGDHLSDDDLHDLGERIAQQVSPDPPVLTYQGTQVERF